jgi:hypothetical protein
MLDSHPARRQKERAIDTGEFTAMFGDGVVRVLLNWSRLGEPEVRVRQSFSRSWDRLGELFTVWYSTPDGRPAEWDSESAQPMRVRDAAATASAWESLGRMVTSGGIGAGASSTCTTSVRSRPSGSSSSSLAHFPL